MCVRGVYTVGAPPGGRPIRNVLERRSGLHHSECSSYLALLGSRNRTPRLYQKRTPQALRLQRYRALLRKSEPRMNLEPLSPKSGVEGRVRIRNKIGGAVQAVGTIRLGVRVDAVAARAAGSSQNLVSRSHYVNRGRPFWAVGRAQGRRCVRLFSRAARRGSTPRGLPDWQAAWAGRCTQHGVLHPRYVKRGWFRPACA